MIVLDVSAAVAMSQGTQMGEALRQLMLKGEKIISSSLFHAEIRNVFWKYVRSGILPDIEAKLMIEVSEGLVDEFIPIEENADEALTASCRYDHSVYDMLYLTLARRYDAVLYTLDRRLMKVAATAGVRCIEPVDLD